MQAVTRSFLVFLAILAGAEIVTRGFMTRSMEGRFDYGYHPTAGFEETADGRVDLVRGGGRRFFPQSFDKQRPAGTFRIMVIGDSVARGKSVEASYAGQLGRELQARGVRAESLNLALPGYGARRKDVVLQQALKYQPSLVVLHLNLSNEYEDEREWSRRDDFNSPHPKNWLMRSLVLRHLYEMKTEKLYWQWLERSVRSKAGVSDFEAELRAAADTGSQQRWLERVQDVTLAGLSRLQAAGVPVILVTQATRRKQDGVPILDDGTLDRWARAQERPGVACLPMTGVFTAEQAARIYSDSNHLREEGHRMLARALADLIAQKGWLPVPPQ